MTLPATVHLGNAFVFLDMNSADVRFWFATAAALPVCEYLFMSVLALTSREKIGPFVGLH